MTVTAKTLINSKFCPGSSSSEYTVPASTKTIIDKFTATNTDSSSRTLTVFLVPSGGTAGSSNTVLSVVPIAAGAVRDCTELQNQILSTGDILSVQASVGSVIVIRASGREIT